MKPYEWTAEQIAAYSVTIPELEDETDDPITEAFERGREAARKEMAIPAPNAPNL
jgi:hypothetical protein